jgi:hypothetical protein
MTMGIKTGRKDANSHGRMRGKDKKRREGMGICNAISKISKERHLSQIPCMSYKQNPGDHYQPSESP